MRRPNWVAEQPELHLLPHLQRACESLPLRLVEAHASADGSYDVELAWEGEEAGVGLIRASVFGLLGAIAEPASYIRQRRTAVGGGSAEKVTFEVVTGIVDETPFKPHGHVLRLNVRTAPQQ
jgi:hypothetical protein